MLADKVEPLCRGGEAAALDNPHKGGEAGQTVHGGPDYRLERDSVLIERTIIRSISRHICTPRRAILAIVARSKEPIG